MAKNEPTGKKTKSEKTRQLIIRSFMELMRQKKWDRISVIEICRNADITRGTFYQYFGDIYDLLEQIEICLIEDLISRYEKCRKRKAVPAERFLGKFDTSPPEIYLTWFRFCKDHQDLMIPLLDRKFGDTYFVKKLKRIIGDTVENSMNQEGMAKDQLRDHFIEVFVELHFLAAQSWLDGDPEEPLSAEDIVNLLNTMRVGAHFLAWKEKADSPEKN